MPNPLIKRSDVETEENWLGIMPEIPFIQFPRTWRVAVVPPFSGAVARFIVLKPNGHKVSVYLDWYGHLGAMDDPYWEVYPYNGDVYRCGLHNTEQLIQTIRESKPGVWCD